MATQDGMTISDLTAVTDFDIAELAREPGFNSDISPEKHGRVGTYRNGYCKCSACREASNNYRRRYYAQQHGLPADDPRHGTANAYSNFRCSCALCRAARRKDNAERRKKRTDATEQ